jgi:hypothetical protein
VTRGDADTQADRAPAAAQHATAPGAGDEPTPAGGAWFPFPPGTAMGLVIRGGAHARTVGVWACSLRVDRVLVVAPGRVEPGTRVGVPLQTVDAEVEEVPGRVESCVPVRAGEHRTHVRFDGRVDAARFAVFWGVTIDAGGNLVEIAPAGGSRGTAARPGTGRAGRRSERAANIVTIANELSRRAAEGADDAELREIAELLQALLAPEDQSRAA